MHSLRGSGRRGQNRCATWLLICYGKPMTGTSSTLGPYLFGDLLALAREGWAQQMQEGLAQRGYGDYRRSDAMIVRLLSRAPASISRLGVSYGVSRQAARKLATGLQERGYAIVQRDETDSRQFNIMLTKAGRAYAKAIREVIADLNRGLATRVSPRQLAAADAVLRAAIPPGSHWARIAARVPSP